MADNKKVVLGIGAVALLLLLTRKSSGLEPQGSEFTEYTTLLVRRRGTGETNNITEFITPAAVAGKASELGSIENCYQFVVTNFPYASDYGEYWSFPAETLIRGNGDCEDTAFLLTSLLRNIEPETYAALGWYTDGTNYWAHAWVLCRDCIFESTLDTMPDNIWQRADTMGQYYIPMLYLADNKFYIKPGYVELISEDPESLGKKKVSAPYDPQKQESLKNLWAGR